MYQKNTILRSTCKEINFREKYKGKIPKGYQVYHKNGITVDNRLENLGLTKHFKYERTDTR